VRLGAFLLPVALRPAAIAAGIPLAPPILSALFAVVVRRSNPTLFASDGPAQEMARNGHLTGDHARGLDHFS
jgi:hypothetical protein